MSRQFRASRGERSFPRDVFGERDVIRLRLGGRSGQGSHLSKEKLSVLPTTAHELFKDDDEDDDKKGHQAYGWTSTLKSILNGTRDEASPLSLLGNHEKTIVRDVYGYIANEWDKRVKLTIPAALVGNAYDSFLMSFPEGRSQPHWHQRLHLDLDYTKSSGFEQGFVAFAKCGQVTFPAQNDRNVNMMPFIFGNKDSLPQDLQCFFPLIEACPYLTDEIGKVGYLTVHESYVEAGTAQRRPGLHIESPGVFSDDPNAAAFTPGVEHPWGMGVFFGPDHYEGGIYFASSVSDTSEVWDALVDKNVPGIVDRHGGCEHLRGIIGEGTKLQAGELVWMTDCTPHEALPQNEPGPRTFFRVVTPYISHWYADHSTPNPKVSLPDDVTVIHGSKFVTENA